MGYVIFAYSIGTVRSLLHNLDAGSAGLPRASRKTSIYARCMLISPGQGAALRIDEDLEVAKQRLL